MLERGEGSNRKEDEEDPGRRAARRDTVSRTMEARGVTEACGGGG